MSLSPLRLLEHAERLVNPPSGVATRAATEEDLRRAESAAYYAVFHTAAGAIADLFFWAADPTHSIYERIYRSPAHSDINNCCKRYESLCYRTGTAFNRDIRAFAHAFQTLYKKRLDADYKPVISLTHNDARKTVQFARDTIGHFQNADPDARKVFLGLIVFPPRNDP